MILPLPAMMLEDLTCPNLLIWTLTETCPRTFWASAVGEHFSSVVIGRLRFGARLAAGAFVIELDVGVLEFAEALVDVFEDLLTEFDAVLEFDVVLAVEIDALFD